MTLLKFSIGGAIVTAVCCFTPVLPIILGAIGLSWLVGMLDYVLLPLLAVFLIIIGISLWRQRKAQ